MNVAEGFVLFWMRLVAPLVKPCDHDNFFNCVAKLVIISAGALGALLGLVIGFVCIPLCRRYRLRLPFEKRTN
jgi:hypothetical protein